MTQNLSPAAPSVAAARVDADVRAALERLAKARNRSVAGEIREALREHLERAQPTTTEGETP